MTEQRSDDWAGKLRGCDAVSDAAVILAQAVGETAQAWAVAVFLLDYLQENLLPYASWPNADGSVAVPRQPLPLQTRKEQDILALSMRAGRQFSLPLSTAAPELLQFFPGLPEDRRSIAMTFPLVAMRNAPIGSVLLVVPSDAVLSRRITDVCDLAAMVIDGLVRQKKYAHLVRDLSDDVESLKTRRQREQGAAARLLMGSGAVMREIRSEISTVAGYDVPVLITGETGTGKELAATAIHAASARSEAPYVTVNCGALPAQLLESELFGHVRGAFTGAVNDHTGLLRQANGGTLLLDEVGELPLEVQVKLLRVLEDGKVRPLGGIEPYAVDVRILAATNRELQQAIDRGTFRLDLYQRLAGYELHMPPLRERIEDIPGLAAYFLTVLQRELNREDMSFSAEALHALTVASYPGNVRELLRRIRQAVIKTAPHETTIHRHLLFEGLPETKGPARVNLPQAVAALEAVLIEQCLHACAGNISQAAKSLGVPDSTLRSKLRPQQ